MILTPLYDTMGRYRGFLVAGGIFAPDGTYLGLADGTGVFAKEGTYVGELEQQMLVDRGLARADRASSQRADRAPRPRADRMPRASRHADAFARLDGD